VQFSGSAELSPDGNLNVYTNSLWEPTSTVVSGTVDIEGLWGFTVTGNITFQGSSTYVDWISPSGTDGIGEAGDLYDSNGYVYINGGASVVVNVVGGGEVDPGLTWTLISTTSAVGIQPGNFGNPNLPEFTQEINPNNPTGEQYWQMAS